MNGPNSGSSRAGIGKSITPTLNTPRACSCKLPTSHVPVVMNTAFCCANKNTASSRPKPVKPG